MANVKGLTGLANLGNTVFSEFMYASIIKYKRIE